MKPEIRDYLLTRAEKKDYAQEFRSQRQRFNESFNSEVFEGLGGYLEAFGVLCGRTKDIINVLDEEAFVYCKRSVMYESTQRLANINNYIKEFDGAARDSRKGVPDTARHTKCDSAFKDVLSATFDLWENLIPLLLRGQALSDLLNLTRPLQESCTEIDQQLKAQKGEMDSQKAEIEKARQSLEESTSRADMLVDKLRKALGDSSIEIQASHFNTQADKEARFALGGLVVTVVLVITIVGLALYFSTQAAPATVAESIHFGVNKALSFGAISTLLWMSIRSYNAHRHNETVNRHRANALKTYSAIVQAAGDSANRDIVLTKAAECIFLPQPSGFSKADMAESGPLNIIGVLPQNPGVTQPKQ